MLSSRDYIRIACAALVLALGLGLAGCQSIRDAMGITKFSPDEFLVFTRKPLLMPPDLNLRPPQRGALARNELPPAGEAEVALFPRGLARATQIASSAYSDGEIALLSSASALSANSEIRRIVDDESRQPGTRRAPVVTAALLPAPALRLVRPSIMPPVPSAVAAIALPEPSVLAAITGLEALMPVQIAEPPRPAPQRIAAARSETAGLGLLRRTLDR